MAIIILSKEADPLKVAEELRKIGITMRQKVSEGRYVVWLNKRQWFVSRYPDLAAVYAADRDFWRSVRKRKRNGETVTEDELRTHANWLKNEEKRIIDSYENDDRKTLPPDPQGV